MMVNSCTWKHWDNNITFERFAGCDLFNDALSYFHGNQVVTERCLIVEPSKCTSQEILIFHIDESFGLTNLSHHAFLDGVFDQTPTFLMET